MGLPLFIIRFLFGIFHETNQPAIKGESPAGTPEQLELTHPEPWATDTPYRVSVGGRGRCKMRNGTKGGLEIPCLCLEIS